VKARQIFIFFVYSGLSEPSSPKRNREKNKKGKKASPVQKKRRLTTFLRVMTMEIIKQITDLRLRMVNVKEF